MTTDARHVLQRAEIVDAIGSRGPFGTGLSDEACLVWSDAPPEKLVARCGNPEDAKKIALTLNLFSDLINVLKDATEWRPIETAPKDGSEVECWCPDRGVRVLFWDCEEYSPRWWLVGGAPMTSASYEPTHWRKSLPAPQP